MQRRVQRRAKGGRGRGGPGTALRCFLAVAIALAIGWTALLLSSRGLNSGGGTAEVEWPPKRPSHVAEEVTGGLRHGSGSGSRTPPPTSWLESDLHRCQWIKDLLAKNEALGAELPKPGESQGNGVVFWLKRPVLHTRNPETGEEIMILKYNIYNSNPSWTQHTDKFRNTVKVLLSTRDRELRIFPKLHGFCNDIDGFHYIAVEYIDFDINKLPKPTSMDACVDRAERALDLFAQLDEDLHLMLADFKPGQWMARKDGSLVLQDVDDILEPFTKSPYPEQVEWLQSRLVSRMKLPKSEIVRLFPSTLFPDGGITIRYAVLNTALLLDNLGFRWSDCGPSQAFTQCRRELIDWTVTIEQDWPSPRQVRDALLSCHAKGSFDRTARPPAAWRDTVPVADPSSIHIKGCQRDFDRPEAAPSFPSATTTAAGPRAPIDVTIRRRANCALTNMQGLVLYSS